MKNSLAIAYNVKNKKKMTKGGKVESAQAESHPVPDQSHKDSKMVNQNTHMKSAPAPTPDPRPIKAASKMSVAPIKHPKLMGNPMFKVRDALEMREEALMKMKPDSADKQPPEYYNEEDANKQGPVPEAQKKFAQGGEVSIMKEMYDQPEPEAEEEEEHHDSIAAAIMSKRKMLAEGGEVDADDGMTEEPNMYYKLNKQALKKPMMGDRIDEMHQPEDSNMTDDPREAREENELDMIDKLRAKIAKKRFFGE